MEKIKAILELIPVDVILASVIVAIAACVATYHFTLKAQKNNFKIVFLNEARAEIVGAIRAYKDWLKSLGYYFIYVPETRPRDESRTLLKLYHSKDPENFFYRLEQYERFEDFFINLSEVRKVLQEKNEYLKKNARYILGPDFVGNIKQRKMKASDKLKLLEIQYRLVEELRDFIQVIFLKQVFGKKIKERKLEDETEPHLTWDKKGRIRLNRGIEDLLENL